MPDAPGLSPLPAVDIGGEGDLDLLGRDGRNHHHHRGHGGTPYLNLSRQVHAPFLARAGQPSRVDFHGLSKGQPCLPLLSAQGGRMDLGPVGPLRLDTRYLFALPPILLDARLRGSRTSHAISRG